MAEKQKQNQRHQDAADIERVFDILQRMLDERGGPVQSRVQRHAVLVQDRLHLLQRRFQRQRDFHRVRAVLAGHRHQDSGLAHDERVAEFWFRAFPHGRHVLEPHALALMRRDDDFAQQFRRERLALGLDENALVRIFHKTRAHHSSCHARRTQHIRDRKAGRQQTLWPHLNLQLPHVSAKHDAACYARNGKHSRFDRPVRQRPQLHRRKFFRDEADLQQIHRGRSERRHLRGLHTNRQFTGDRAQLFREHLTRDKNIRALVENRRDDGQT